MRAKLSDIYVGRRHRRDYGDVEDLARDMEEHGQITSITVRPPTEEERDLGIVQPHILVAGGRRYAAASILGWDDIEIFSREEMSQLKHRIIELHENIKRKDMTWDEVAAAKNELLQLRRLENPDIRDVDVAAEINDTPSTFSRDVKAAEVIAKKPHLKKAGTRKAAMRMSEMEDHAERLTVKQVMNEQRSSFMSVHLNAVQTCTAIERLRKTQPRSIDLIMTDPPYGIRYFESGDKRTNEKKDEVVHYDDTISSALDEMTHVVPLMVRAIRETGWIAMFLGKELYDHCFQLFSDVCGEHCDYRFNGGKRCKISIEEQSVGECRFLRPEMPEWIWYRPNSRNRPRYPERHAQNVYERILVVNAGKARLNYACTNLLSFDAEYGNDRVHPNQKPANLLREIVQRTTAIGDTVADYYFGSGAHLAAAGSIGRYFEGSDSNPEMRAIAHGMITRDFSPPPSRGKKQSALRYEKQLSDSGLGVEDFSEVEVDDAASE